jgi:hypothetical protein
MNKRNKYDEYIIAWGWSLDFCRALNERNKFFKWLFRFAVGNYAYHEYLGLLNHFDRTGAGADYDYGLKTAPYHNNLTRNPK